MRIATDIGGTFTDLVVLDDAGMIQTMAHRVRRGPRRARTRSSWIWTGMERFLPAPFGPTSPQRSPALSCRVAAEYRTRPPKDFDILSARAIKRHAFLRCAGHSE